VGALDHGFKGTCALALQETARPDVKQVKSTLMGNVLRLGDPETRAEEAMEILIKTSKCTALTRPKGWKRFGDVGIAGADQGDVKPQTQGSDVSQWSQLKMRTEYFVDADKEGGAKKEEDIEGEEPREDAVEKIAQEELVRGFKFGASYVPSPEGQFPKLSTAKGIDLCGFFQSKNARCTPTRPVLLTDRLPSLDANCLWARSTTYGRTPARYSSSSPYRLSCRRCLRKA
jgi:ATP-dependent DNA helicase 2 subunit 2